MNYSVINKIIVYTVIHILFHILKFGIRDEIFGICGRFDTLSTSPSAPVFMPRWKFTTGLVAPVPQLDFQYWRGTGISTAYHRRGSER